MDHKKSAGGDISKETGFDQGAGSGTGLMERTSPKRLDLDFRPFESRDGPALSALHGEVFGRKIDPAYWNWKYYLNPAGPHNAYLAVHDGRIVGEITAVPVRIKVGDREIIASQTCDIVIAPSYRKSTPFFRLFKVAYKDYETKGWEFIYGLPLESTYRLGTKMFGFKSAGALKSLVKILDPTPFLRKRIKNRVMSGTLGTLGVAGLRLRNMSRSIRLNRLKIKEVEQFDSRFDDLWYRCSPRFPIAVARTPEYLNWRYFQNPMTQYKVLAVYSGEECRGFAVYCMRERDGITRCFLVDLLAHPDDAAVIKCLLSCVAEASYRQGADSVNTWMLEHTFLYPFLKETGYVERDTPHYLIVKPTKDASDSFLHERGNWFLTIGDSDHY